MNTNLQEIYTKEALRMLEGNVKPFRKMAAIYEIKQQPYYDLPEFDKRDKVIIRSPKRYSEI